MNKNEKETQDQEQRWSHAVGGLREDLYKTEILNLKALPPDKFQNTGGLNKQG